MIILEALCRELALTLTERASVTGTKDEAAFGPWLVDLLQSDPRFRPATAWSFPVAPGDDRQCVAVLVRGKGPETVILTGHYDTVTTSDYADLEGLAQRPTDLSRALESRHAGADPSTIEGRCWRDLTSGKFLAGRGLLDMKAGLAAGLAVVAGFGADRDRIGNILFLAVPDEENSSAGARAAAVALPDLAEEHGLQFRLAINLDAIADDGDGTKGRVVALGTVGKTLPTAFVVGLPVHSGFPLRGLNAGVLAAALATRLEWAPELTDETDATVGTPASLLALKDGKDGYDVTTPATAFAYWNVLNNRRDPGAVLDVVEKLARDAVGACLRDLCARAMNSHQTEGALNDPPSVEVLRFRELVLRARQLVPDLDKLLNEEADRLTATGASIPLICQALTSMVWKASRLTGPAIVLGFGSTPYLATHLEDSCLREAVQNVVHCVSEAEGCKIRTTDYFAGISDMSFFGQGDTAAFDVLRTDTPGWDRLIGLSRTSVAGLPTINAGPWGRDYHTPYERIEVEYGFRVLPRLLEALCRQVLDTHETHGPL